MNGSIDWTALPVIIEIMGVVNIELFIRQLALIRDFKNE